jgi:hypothetical protein
MRACLLLLFRLRPLAIDGAFQVTKDEGESRLAARRLGGSHLPTQLEGASEFVSPFRRTRAVGKIGSCMVHQSGSGRRWARATRNLRRIDPWSPRSRASLSLAGRSASGRAVRRRRTRRRPPTRRPRATSAGPSVLRPAVRPTQAGPRSARAMAAYRTSTLASRRGRASRRSIADRSRTSSARGGTCRPRRVGGAKPFGGASALRELTENPLAANSGCSRRSAYQFAIPTNRVVELGMQVDL